jgi:hypothetical protein
MHVLLKLVMFQLYSSHRRHWSHIGSTYTYESTTCTGVGDLLLTLFVLDTPTVAIGWSYWLGLHRR